MLHTISRQRATFIFIITLLCFIGLFSPVQGRAADLPDRAEVQSQLNTLNKQKELTPQDKLVQQDLTQTLETLDKIERIKSETAQLRQQVEQAPAKLRQAVESLNNLSDVPNDDATRKTLSTLSLRQLESRVTQTLDDLQNAQNDLATYNSQLVSLQTQPERVQNAMFNASPAAAADPQSSEWHLGGRRDPTPDPAGAVAGSTGIAQRADRATAQEPRRQHYPAGYPAEAA